MTTKAALVARVAELERQNANALRALDALSEATGLRGVRVVWESGAKTLSFCVVGPNLPHDTAARIAAAISSALASVRDTGQEGAG